MANCMQCGEDVQLNANGICVNCEGRQISNINSVQRCRLCGREMPVDDNGLCLDCCGVNDFNSV